MKRKVKNIFAKEHYNCFGCSPTNVIGLQLDFYEEDQYITAQWKPSSLYEGYPGSIHGGIQSTLLDEIAAWTMYVKAQCAGVTAKMKIRYRKQLDSTQESILIRGKIKEKSHSLCIISAEILNQEGLVCTEAEITYFAFSPEKSTSKCHIPSDFDSFFD